MAEAGPSREQGGRHGAGSTSSRQLLGPTSGRRHPAEPLLSSLAAVVTNRGRILLRAAVTSSLGPNSKSWSTQELLQMCAACGSELPVREGSSPPLTDVPHPRLTHSSPSPARARGEAWGFLTPDVCNAAAARPRMRELPSSKSSLSRAVLPCPRVHTGSHAPRRPTVSPSNTPHVDVTPGSPPAPGRARTSVLGPARRR